MAPMSFPSVSRNRRSVPTVGITVFAKMIFPLVAYLAFLVGVVVVWAWSRGLADRRRGQGPQQATLGLQAVVLLVVGFLSGGALSVAITAVIAFTSGMQIAAFRDVGRATFTTTVMTTNSMKTVNATLAALTSADPKPAPSPARTARRWPGSSGAGSSARSSVPGWATGGLGRCRAVRRRVRVVPVADGGPCPVRDADRTTLCRTRPRGHSVGAKRPRSAYGHLRVRPVQGRDRAVELAHGRADAGGVPVRVAAAGDQGAGPHLRGAVRAVRLPRSDGPRPRQRQGGGPRPVR